MHRWLFQRSTANSLNVNSMCALTVWFRAVYAQDQCHRKLFSRSQDRRNKGHSAPLIVEFKDIAGYSCEVLLTIGDVIERRRCEPDAKSIYL